MICELIETNKMECSGSGGGTPDDMAAAQSFLSVPTLAVNAFRKFLQNALSKKKRHVDLGGVLVKKRNEPMKLRKQVSDLQEKIRVLTQKLSAKELVLDTLTRN